MRRNTLATLSMLAIVAWLPASWARGQYEMSDPQARLAGLDRADAGAGYAEANSDGVNPQPVGRSAIYKMSDPTAVTNCCNTEGNCCNSNCCQNDCCSNNCCNNSCCSSGCCNKGCGCGIGGLFGGADPVGGFVGGFEYVWFRPFASNGDLPSANFGAVGVGATDRTANFNYQITPRIYLGYVGESGLGARVRYWQYDHGAGTNSATDPVTGNVATIAAGYKFQTFDIELTQQSSFRAWNFLFAGGVRYASFSSDSGNSIVDGVGAPVGFSNLTNNISGTGLTTAFQARRALNSTGSFVWLTNLRGSLLFGNHRATANQNVIIVGVGPITTSTAQKNRDDLFSIWEINMGPQWHMPLANGGRFFVGATAEAQLWQGVGGYSYNSSGGNIQQSGVALGNLGLVGFGGNIGITR